MIYLFSRCYGGLFHKHMIMLKLFYLLYTSFMLNDQVIVYSRKKAMMEQNTSHGPFLLYLYGSANIDNQALY